MISLSRLRAGLSGDRLVIDENGDPVEVELSGQLGPAVLLVTPVTDAVKRLQDGQVESLDRDAVWVVEAIVLDRTLLDRLEGDRMRTEDLLAAVRELGYTWEISPTSSP